MKLLVFNVKYSANLGDGVIAECLEYEIGRQQGWQVISLDIAGRKSWKSPGKGKLRALILSVLQALPSFAQDMVVGVILGRQLTTSIVPGWQEHMDQADAAVFGGGQLIQDGDLNFPLKLSAAGKLCRAYHLPVGLFAVGAAPSKSKRGRALFAEVLDAREMVYLAARDERSCQILNDFGHQTQLCRDPGLLASLLWPIGEQTGRGGRRLIGLGITHPAVLSHHGSECVERISHKQALALYAFLAQELAAKGFDVICFTNGAGEDELLLSGLREQLGREPGGNIRFAPRCKEPASLARLIAGCDGVVAHRLHANIIAYSYQRPSIGLRWDDKLDAFFESIGEADSVLPFNQDGCGQIASHLEKKLELGVDQQLHRKVLGETSEGVERLCLALGQAIGTVEDRGQEISDKGRCTS